MAQDDAESLPNRGREESPPSTFTEYGPDFEKARELIKKYVQTHNVTFVELANRAGISKGNLSNFVNNRENYKAMSLENSLHLYRVMAENLDLSDRREFLKAIGGSFLINLLGQELLFNLIHDDNLPGLENANLRGMQLMLRANAIHDSMEDGAVTLYKLAETVFGPNSNNSALAALFSIQCMLNLTDYKRAQEELDLVEIKYSSIMDASTLIELNRIKGWLAYYQGFFLEAIRYLKESINLANSVEDLYKAESSIHFLGRTYADLSKQLRLTNQDYSQADRYEKLALTQLNKAKSLHQKYGSDAQTAFDHLRIAQLKRETEYITASNARTSASQIFGNHRGGWLHVNMEDALIKIQDEACTASSRKQIKKQLLLSVEGWAEVNYAKGMADALKAMGLEEQLNGRKSGQALEYYISALLIYPFENHFGNVELQEDLTRVALACENLDQELNRIQEKVGNRTDSFAFLNYVKADRSNTSAVVFNKLRALRKN